MHVEKLMSINGWTYLVIKIIIFMNGAYIRVCRTVLIQVKRNPTDLRARCWFRA